MGASAQSVAVSESEIPAVVVPEKAAELSALESAQATLAKVDASSDMGDGVKQSLQVIYQEVVQRLKRAEDDNKQAAAFEASIGSAPGDTDRLRMKMDLLPPVEETAEVEQMKDLAVLRQTVETRRAELISFKNTKTAEVKELDRLHARPVEIATRLPEARTELGEVESALAEVGAGVSERDVADRALLESKQAEFSGEIFMLEQERSSQGARSGLLKARYALTEAQVKQSEVSLVLLEAQLNKLEVSDADEVIAQVDEYVKSSAEGSEDAKRLGQAVTDLSKALRDSTLRLQDVSGQYDALSIKLSQLKVGFNQVQEEVKLGGLNGVLAQVLVEQRSQLPHVTKIEQSLSDRRDALRERRLYGFALEGDLREQPAEVAVFGESPSVHVEGLLGTRLDLLHKLQANNQALIRELAKVDAVERSYLAVVLEVRHYLWKKLFWERSSPSIQSGMTIDLGGAFIWLFDGSRFRETRDAFLLAVKSRPYTSYAFAFVFLLFLLKP